MPSFFYSSLTFFEQARRIITKNIPAEHAIKSVKHPANSKTIPPKSAAIGLNPCVPMFNTLDTFAC